MNRSKFRAFGFAVSAGLIMNLPHLIRAYAAEPNTFVIAAAAGYGLEDCLGEGGECGQVVADAWCEAHGRGAALKFGRSEGDDDANHMSAPTDARPYFITCGN